MVIDLPIKNFEAQQRVFQSQARYKIVSKGRRFGLTKGAANNFIEEALDDKFKQGLWVDTVNSNIDRYVERYFLPHLKKLPDTIYWNWKEQKKILYIHKSYIDFRSADRPENIEGFGYDKFFINEAGIVLKNEYLWNNAIRPMMWDFEAPGIIGGTPKIGCQVFKELIARAKDPAQPRYEYFNFSTFDNPYLNAADIREEIKDIPERVVRQEIFGEILDDTGVVFRNIQRLAIATPKKPEPGHTYVIGLDLAKLQDWTVLAVYDRDTNEQVYQDRFQRLEWPFQKMKIKEIATHYNNALCIMDSTGIGEPIYDDLVRMGVAIEPYKFTNTSKKELIEKMAIWVDLARFRIINLPETINEFDNFTYDVSGSGKIIYEAPQGFHDDIVIAHALAIHSLQPVIAKVTLKEPTVVEKMFAQALASREEDDYDEI